MNPFKYGMVVTGDDFCGRKALLKQIVGHIKSAQNVVVLGERRVGKTSLIAEAIRRTKGLRKLMVNLQGVKTTDAVCKRILTELALAGSEKGWLSTVFEALKHLRPVISTDPITLRPEVHFKVSADLKADSIPEVLTLLEKLGKGKRLVVVFDEFQDILRIDGHDEILALMRGKIQYQKDIAYLFAGSLRHKMERIFTHANSPFFKSAVPIDVGPIPYDEFAEYLKDKFAEGNHSTDEKALRKIFEIANDIPGDVQQFCKALWDVLPEGEPVTESKLKDALLIIFAAEERGYVDYVNLLTAQQYRCLLALAKQGGKSILSSAFMAEAGVRGASGIQSAIGRLEDLNIIFKQNGEYRFVNPFFKVWLLHSGD
jgi:hypothetical protein